jgi:hypothetical protein
VHVEVEGERDDLALIDAVLLDETFVGARAMWDVHRVRTLVLTRADPAVVGMSAIGGLLHPVPDSVEGGLLVEIGGGAIRVVAPIAPGLFLPVDVRSVRPLALDETVEVTGPGVLALDGERERRLTSGQRVRLAVRRDGPRLIDVAQTLRLAACRGLFRLRPTSEAADGD